MNDIDLRGKAYRTQVNVLNDTNDEGICKERNGEFGNGLLNF